jgi:hypothetical protein
VRSARKSASAFRTPEIRCEHEHLFASPGLQLTAVNLPTLGFFLCVASSCVVLVWLTRHRYDKFDVVGTRPFVATKKSPKRTEAWGCRVVASISLPESGVQGRRGIGCPQSPYNVEIQMALRGRNALHALA